MWDWVQLQPKRDRIKWENYELDNGIYITIGNNIVYINKQIK